MNRLLLLLVLVVATGCGTFGKEEKDVLDASVDTFFRVMNMAERKSGEVRDLDLLNAEDQFSDELDSVASQTGGKLAPKSILTLTSEHIKNINKVDDVYGRDMTRLSHHAENYRLFMEKIVKWAESRMSKKDWEKLGTTLMSGYDAYQRKKKEDEEDKLKERERDE